MSIFGFGKKHDNAVTSTVFEAPTNGGRDLTLDLNKGGVLNLAKNDFLNLSKSDSTLKNIRVSSGWDVNVFGSDYDLDLCAILVHDKNRNECIYYGHKNGTGVHLDHDNLTGDGDGDDENMFVDFSAVDPDVKKIVVCVAIYNGASRGQKFGKVRNAYVRLVDQAQRPEKEICRYNLTEDGGDATAVEFAELTRTDAGWTFRALGNYHRASIEDLCNLYR